MATSGEQNIIPLERQGGGKATGDADNFIRPSNPEAEQALLGALLASNPSYDFVSGFLKPEHFAFNLHGKIYQKIGVLLERGHSADAIQLQHLLADDPDLELQGGPKYLFDLQEAVVSIINVRDYANAIHDLYLRRELIFVGSDLYARARSFEDGETSKDLIENAESRLYNLAEIDESERSFQDLNGVMKKSMQSITQAFENPDKLLGLDTGIDRINREMGGLHRSDLVVLAGRPGMGKTALALTLAFNVSKRGKRVAFFSLEMSDEQLATRLLSWAGKVEGDAIRNSNIRKEDYVKLAHANKTLQSLPFFVDDTPALSMTSLRAKARRLKRLNGGLDLIVVDYIQYMRGSNSQRAGESRALEISEITRGLKALAKEFDIPVLALSQLSRAVELREDKRPQLSDLRESGTIEQDADIVMFLYREAYYLRWKEPSQNERESDEAFEDRTEKWKVRLEEKEREADLMVAKQRHGRTTNIKLAFHGKYTWFDNLVADSRLPEHHDP